jgi:hypothetical protein
MDGVKAPLICEDVTTTGIWSAYADEGGTIQKREQIAEIAGVRYRRHASRYFIDGHEQLLPALNLDDQWWELEPWPTGGEVPPSVPRVVCPCGNAHLIVCRAGYHWAVWCKLCQRRYDGA